MRHIPHQGGTRVIRHAVAEGEATLKMTTARIERPLLGEVDRLLEHLGNKGRDWRALGPGQSDVSEKWVPL